MKCDKFALVPTQQPRTLIARGALLLSLLAVVACTRETPPLPAPAQAPPSALRPIAASSASARPDDASWEGFLAEHLPHGVIYINDANARDSTSAFEAALITEATPPGSGPDRPDGIEAYWKPTVDQALAVGNLILAQIEPMSGASAPSYRYVLTGVIAGRKQRILAQPLCDEPRWWKAAVGQSKLCRSAGTCVHTISPSLRSDCQLRFSYDVGAGRLERSAGQ